MIQQFINLVWYGYLCLRKITQLSCSTAIFLKKTAIDLHQIILKIQNVLPQRFRGPSVTNVVVE